MRDIWLISDTHFHHDNIIKYCDRPFSSSEHMDEILVQNWNSVVKPGDKVYHLGDVFMGDKEKFKRLWPRLTGQKRLVVGNHDDIKFLSNGGFFAKVELWRIFKDHNLLLTHVPLHIDSFRGMNEKGINVHGHTHEKGSPKGPYVSVCVELTNYTPVHIEDITRLHLKQQMSIK